MVFAQGDRWSPLKNNRASIPFYEREEQAIRLTPMPPIGEAFLYDPPQR